MDQKFRELVSGKRGQPIDLRQIRYESLGIATRLAFDELEVLHPLGRISRGKSPSKETQSEVDRGTKDEADHQSKTKNNQRAGDFHEALLHR
jgi:hypothetical protein